MKMNKKGFTLIEMLVVIAIIAVLVSIIIPVVGNSSTKAAAAADAANLRSAAASASTQFIEAFGGKALEDGKTYDLAILEDMPELESKSYPEAEVKYYVENGSVQAYFVVASGTDAGYYSIAHFADVADGVEEDASNYDPPAESAPSTFELTAASTTEGGEG